MGKLMRVLRPPLPHPVSIGAAGRSAKGGGGGGAGQHPSLFTSHPAQSWLQLLFECSLCFQCIVSRSHVFPSHQGWRHWREGVMSYLQGQWWRAPPCVLRVLAVAVMAPKSSASRWLQEKFIPMHAQSLFHDDYQRNLRCV